MRLALALTLLATACGDSHHRKPDAPGIDDAPIDVMFDAPIDANPYMPATLFDTGLCVDHACTQISAGISSYTPRYPLWADAASKHRWMQLPPNGKIDTTDPDHWVFPVGTKFWKEFTAKDASNNDVRVETRFIWRIANNGVPNDWYYVAYQWNATEDDTIAVPFGQADANGTTHDIPNRIGCSVCHGNLPQSFILGFGAIQLDHAAATGDIAIDDLVSSHWLTQNPPGATQPHYPLPGAGTTAQDAIGYLHANCGHCHNPTSKVYTDQQVTMDLRLTTTSLSSLSTTPVYQTAVDHDATMPVNSLTKLVVRNQPDQSILMFRFESDPMSSYHMPKLGSEVTDAAADTILRDWITNIQ
jgi:hypothetical protein